MAKNVLDMSVITVSSSGDNIWCITEPSTTDIILNSPSVRIVEPSIFKRILTAVKYIINA